MTHPDVRLSHRGDHVPAEWHKCTRGASIRDGAGLVAELAAWLAVLPEGSAVTHLSAAALRGWWLPPLPEGLPVVIAVPAHCRVRRPGLKVVRRRTPVEIEYVHGLPVESVPATLATCARDLSALDLICLLEAAQTEARLTDDDFSTVERRWGASALASALSRSRGGSESYWEVVLRELHRTVGVEVEPQFDVHDAEGRFVARSDLRLCGTRSLHEYDGECHRSPAQHAHDLRRDRRLQAAGWIRRGYTSRDLVERPVGVLADVDAALGRPHVPERIRAWHELLRASCLTPGGRAALEARVRRSP